MVRKREDRVYINSYYYCTGFRSGWTRSETLPPPQHYNTMTGHCVPFGTGAMVSRASDTDAEPSPATTHNQRGLAGPFTLDTKKVCHYYVIVLWSFDCDAISLGKGSKPQYNVFTCSFSLSLSLSSPLHCSIMESAAFQVSKLWLT